MPKRKKKNDSEDVLDLNPSSIRKRLAKAMSSADKPVGSDHEDDLDLEDILEDLTDEVKSGEEEKTSKGEGDHDGEYDIDLEGVVEEVVGEKSEGAVEEEEKHDGSEGSVEEESDSGVVIDLEDNKTDLESESDESEDDGVDYTFEGYEIPDDFDIIEEVESEEVKDVLRPFTNLIEMLSQADGAVPIAELVISSRDDLSEDMKDVIRREFDGIYICSMDHVVSVHPPIDVDELPLKDYIVESMNIYEVKGLHGFWVMTGVKAPDVDSIIALASTMRMVPPSARYLNYFWYGELVVVVKDDGAHLMAKMNLNPFTFIYAGRKNI